MKRHTKAEVAHQPQVVEWVKAGDVDALLDAIGALVPTDFEGRDDYHQALIRILMDNRQGDLPEKVRQRRRQEVGVESIPRSCPDIQA